MGYRASAKEAGAVVLEPMMKVEVVTPEESMGDIVGDLNRRRGQVNDMSDRSGAKVIKADSAIIRNVWLCYNFKNIIIRSCNFYNGVCRI